MDWQEVAEYLAQTEESTEAQIDNPLWLEVAEYLTQTEQAVQTEQTEQSMMDMVAEYLVAYMTDQDITKEAEYFRQPEGR